MSGEDFHDAWVAARVAVRLADQRLDDAWRARLVARDAYDAVLYAEESRDPQGDARNFTHGVLVAARKAYDDARTAWAIAKDAERDAWRRLATAPCCPSTPTAAEDQGAGR